MQPNTLAVATLTHRDGSTTLISVNDQNTFHEFYRFELDNGSVRHAPRTTARTLEDLAQMQVRHFMRLAKHHPIHAKRVIVDIKIDILDHTGYMDRLEAAPDELGALPVLAVHEDIALYANLGVAREYPVRLPIGYTTLQRRMDIITGRA